MASNRVRINGTGNRHDRGMTQLYNIASAKYVTMRKEL